MRILCIDDDTSFLSIYKNVLEKHAYPEDEILVYQDPLKAISYINEKPIDILITDLILPTMSGIDVMKTIKKVQSYTEVIVVTGHGSIETAVEAISLGARDYLTKPLNHGILLEKIHTMREIIIRTREVEEYRYAKETVEINAMKSVNEMEIKLDGYINMVFEIKNILNENIDCEEKCKIILNHINNIEKEM